MASQTDTKAQEIIVHLNTTAAELFVLLQNSNNDINLTLMVRPEDIVTSTGMVSVRSEVVSLYDVTKALDAAMLMHSSDVDFIPMNNEFRFVLNGITRSIIMPIGMPAKKLEVTVTMVRLPRSRLIEWQVITSAMGRFISKWDASTLLATSATLAPNFMDKINDKK